RSVIVHPIDGRWNANRAVLIVVQMEENVVSDDVAVIVHRNKLLGLINGEILHRVDSKIFEHAQGIWAFEIEIDHMIRLIINNGCCAPGELFIWPVRKFWDKPWDHRRRCLGLAYEVHGAASLLNDFFKLLGHDNYLCFLHSDATSPVSACCVTLKSTERCGSNAPAARIRP